VSDGEGDGLETDFFRRHPPVPRPRSKFVAPPPELTEEQRLQLLERQGRRGGKGRGRMRQTLLPLEIVSKGRFEKSEPTLYRGEDLDVPTFIRRGVVLN
jgi:cell division protein FtsZ